MASWFVFPFFFDGPEGGAEFAIYVHLLGQWLNFKLFGITYLVGGQLMCFPLVLPFCGPEGGAEFAIYVHLLGQWLNFKLFGITYLVGGQLMCFPLVLPFCGPEGGAEFAIYVHLLGQWLNFKLLGITYLVGGQLMCFPLVLPFWWPRRRSWVCLICSCPFFGRLAIHVALQKGLTMITKHFRYLKWRNPHLYKL